MRNPFERISKVIALLAVFFAAPLAKAQTTTINWTDQHQLIDGFGASDIFSPLNTTQAATLFGQGSGQLGFSLLRTIPNYTVDCGSGPSANCGAWFSGQAQDLAYANQYGVSVFLTSAAPPADLSTLGTTSYCQSPSGAQNQISNYPGYAAHLMNVVKSFIQYNSTTPIAISVTDEPDLCPTTYEGALVSGSDVDTLIGGSNLGSSMSSAGLLTNTKISLAEPSQWSRLVGGSWTNPCLTDSNCNRYVGIVDGHDYDYYSCVNSSCMPPNLGSSMHVWMTEVANFNSNCNNTVSDGLTWAQDVHNWMVNANASAWVYYQYQNLNDGFDGYYCLDGTTLRIAAYMVAQWAKFVRPGYYRVDTGTGNPQGGVYVSAFQNTSNGTLVVVAINTNSSSTSQSFSIANGPSFNSVTPWTTSASQNIAQQSAITVNSNSFTYNLPASSVTTFVGSAGSSAPSQSQNAAPVPPVITSIVVK